MRLILNAKFRDNLWIVTMLIGVTYIINRTILIKQKGINFTGLNFHSMGNWLVQIIFRRFKADDTRLNELH